MSQSGWGVSMSLMKRMECVLGKHKNVLLLSTRLALKVATSLRIQQQDFKTSKGWAHLRFIRT
jgi:hypothetical protein